ncbi:MAG: pyrrolo-quinoline quinone [Thalassobius sp.]|nr:pyrrolo-quinoline quinone [Thalassovita sp.]
MQLKNLSFILLIYIVSACTEKEIATENVNWPVYLGDKSSQQYARLDQINIENVTQLKPAWTYSTGDAAADNRSQMQCNPLIIDGVMYGTSPKVKAFAVDAVTGKEIWKFNPADHDAHGENISRGVTIYQDGNQKRLYFASGATLFCLNAETGEMMPDFGNKGFITLREGLRENNSSFYVSSTTPGIIYKDLIIMGTTVSENSDAGPGHIRAYNAKTGETVWTFHTIPHPGEYGYETWPEDGWQRLGGANSWSGMSLDEERGMVFIPTGSASFDFWGGNRKGENLFANCILALNAETGERIWHFQTVHHDLWDRDLPCPPNLITVEKDGKKIAALSQATKSGLVFVLNRETGQPIFPIEEKPVLKTDLMREETWETQPFPLKPEPFARQKMTADDLHNFFPEHTDSLNDLMSKVRTGEPFIPPSTQGTIIFPGFDGGAEWGGQAYDPETGMLYINANEMPWIHQMIEIKNESKSSELLADVGKAIYKVNCAVCHGQELQGDATGSYPPLNNVAERLKRDEVKHIINNGKGFMPGFGHIKSEEKEAILAFLFHEDTKIQPKDVHEIGKFSNEGVVPYTHTGYNRFLLPEGYPAVKPPWGTLSAIDLNKGEIAWQVPLGEFEELTKRGIPKTGTENYGGPIVTTGDLIFIGAAQDEYIRAFNKKTGEELWKYKLPAGGYATPSTYSVNGKQYVVIACGGGKMGTASGDKYVAFSLP